MSIYRGMDKEDMVHMYNRILFNSEKEWNCVICRDEDWPRGWMKSEVKSEREKTNIIYKWYLEKWYQFSSVAQLCPTRCNSMDCSTPGLPVHHQLPEFTETHVHWVRDAIQPSHPLFLPSIFASLRVFSNESVLRLRWPKYWSLSFSISPSSEYSGLISFRMDWLDLLAVQGTFKSLLQHHSSKASILRYSAEPS